MLHNAATYLLIGIALWMLDIIYDKDYHIYKSATSPGIYGVAMFLGIVLWPIGIFAFTIKVLCKIIDRGL